MRGRSPEIVLQQGYPGTFHRDAGNGAHRDSDFGRGESRGVVDAVARHDSRRKPSRLHVQELPSRSGLVHPWNLLFTTRSSRSPHWLVTDTQYGYIRSMRKDIKTSCQKRLSRIEGQVRGLAKMVEEDRYCIDIVTQISAVRAALRRVEEEVLKDHVAHCVEHAITSGNKADQRRKIAELMAVVGRAER